MIRQARVHPFVATIARMSRTAGPRRGMRTWPAVAMLVVGCHGGANAAAPDAPIPAGEPRALLHVRVDLRRSAMCEEELDLALYRARGVELIQWTGGGTSCAGRGATIRYVPGRIGREELIRSIRKQALVMEVVEG